MPGASYATRYYVSLKTVSVTKVAEEEVAIQLSLKGLVGLLVLTRWKLLVDVGSSIQ